MSLQNIRETVDFKSGYRNKYGKFVEYNTSFFCNETKAIHSSVKQKINCKYCGFSNLEKLEYEAQQRLKWFIDGYFIHCLGSLFSKMTTERICEIYNIELNYFRPWI